MRTIRILIVALVGALAVAACSDTPGTVDDAVSSIPDEGEMADALTDIQAEIETVATAIENSDAADDLQTAWSEVRAQINEAMNSITSDEAIDTEAIRAELEEFQAEVEAAGDEVGADLESAWNELRSRIEQLIG